MQKMTITLDIDAAGAVPAEIERLLEAEAKRKARAWFSETIEKEMNRLIEAKTKQLRGYSLDATVERLIKEKVEEAVGQIRITRMDVEKHISERLEQAGTLADKFVQEGLEARVNSVLTPIIQTLANDNMIHLIRQVITTSPSVPTADNQ